ncbi:MAG: formylglycine-generating enzyme family protein [Ignavibacteriales bacterium]|nr:formylglycine-generating enzyme family protein [Ignavibacteriales bacterium]
MSVLREIIIPFIIGILSGLATLWIAHRVMGLKYKFVVPIAIIVFLGIIVILPIVCYNNKPPDWDVVLVSIPAGEFLMGSSLNQVKAFIGDNPNQTPQIFDDETQQREIYLDSFYISKYEITNAHYGIFLHAKTMQDTPMSLRTQGFNLPDQPVVGISWYDAVAFCEWLSDSTKEKYSLPTEAQWEKAARGTDGRKYPWGDDEPDTNKANFQYQHQGTLLVGMKPGGTNPNYGTMDMAGNAAEWCLDSYDENYYKTSRDTANPRGPLQGERKVVRGGSWRDNSFSLRCAARNSFPPDVRRDIIGFRIVKLTHK